MERGDAYRQAGAEYFFPIGLSDAALIAKLVKAVAGPVNILTGPHAPNLLELARLGVALVTFELVCCAQYWVGHLQAIAGELLAQGTYTKMGEDMLVANEFRLLLAV